MSPTIYISFFILLWSSFFQFICAQNPTAQALSRAEKHIKDAEQHYAEMNYTKAKESYQFAARLYRNNNLPEYYARCYNGIGNIYIDLGQYEAAKNKGFEQTLEQLLYNPNFDIDSSLIADAYEGLGRYYSHIVIPLKTPQGTVTKIHYHKALEYHQKALAIRQRSYGNKHAKIALSYYFMGQCHRGFSAADFAPNDSLNPIQKEFEYLQKALQIQLQTIGLYHYQTANTYQALGNFYYEVQKDYHKGFESHQQALKIRQHCFSNHHHPKIASSYIDLAIYFQIMNLFDQELQHLEKALQIQLKIWGDTHAEVAKSYYHLANRLQRAQDFNKALTYYESALKIFKELAQEESLEVAEIHLALAQCFRKIDKPALEFEYLCKSQATYEKLLGKKHLQLGLVYLELGNYYGDKKQFDIALYHYNSTIDIWKQQLGVQHYSLTDAYDRIAAIYQQSGNHEQELFYLMQSLELKKQETYQQQLQAPFEQSTVLHAPVFSSTKQQAVNQQFFKSYLALAQFYKRQTQYREALQYIQQALAAVCPSLTASTINIYANPKTDELMSNIEWLKALQEKGALLLLLYQQNQQQKDLDIALKTYAQALSSLQAFQTQFTLDDSKRQLLEYSMPIYEEAIGAWHTAFQVTQDEQYLNQAFQTVEQSKNILLLHTLQNTFARGNGDIPQDLLEQEQQLRWRLAYYSSVEDTADSDLKQAYLQAKQSYDSLITSFEQEFPNYYHLKHQRKISSPATIQEQLLDDNSLLIEYFIGSQSFYVFRISKTEKTFFKVPIPTQYEELVQNLRGALTNYDIITKHPQWAFQGFSNASHKFYQHFLADFLIDIPSNISKLIIIPDGLLNFIPFEVLIENKPNAKALQERNYKNLAFLLKKYQINYNYSATLLAKNIQTQSGQNNGLCLGFAPAIPSSSNLDSLPWTQKELEAIEHIYKGEYYYGKAATKETFKEKAQAFSIIHLAMHGIVDMEHPMHSLLSFAPNSDSTSKEATSLYAYEIHNLSLQADLVVLSACETGLGKTIQGEGVFSLARAFLYAGAPAIVTTLWEVNDFTSAALIETFYNNLAKGMTKPEALQQAKLTFLSKTDAFSGHPTYWGSFIIIGNPSPLYPAWSWWKYAIILGLLIGLLFGLMHYRQTVKKKN